MICMYCRLRPATQRGKEGVRCPPCGAYVARLLESGDEMTQTYGWMLVIIASRRVRKLYPERKAA